MDAILCPHCGRENPVEASVCEQCNADLSPVKSIVDTANSHYNEALSLAHEGRLDEALGHLEAAIALSSQNAAYYNLLGTINAQKGLFSEAIRAWEKCLALQPEMERAYQNIDKARRMEEVRAEENEQRPQWMTSLVASIAAGVLLIATIAFATSSFMKSRKIDDLTDTILAKEKESGSWKSQFESLTAQFPQDGINGVLKKLAQSEALIADREKRIQDLEQKSERAGENYRERINEFRNNLTKLQQEKTELEQRLKAIDGLQAVIVQNETQIDTLQATIDSLQAALKSANERAENHKKSLLLAQENVRQLQESRDTALEGARKEYDKQLQELRNQALELRDEIARWERTAKDREYAENLVAESLRRLDENDFDLARQSIATALERYPDSPSALFLQQEIDRILDDPLEQEIRRQERNDRLAKRASIKTGLIAKNLSQVQQDYGAGRYDQAIELAQRTLRLEPDNPKDKDNLKQWIAQSEERNREIILLLKAAEKDIESNNIQEAGEKLKKIIQRAPSNEEAQALLKKIAEERPGGTE